MLDKINQKSKKVKADSKIRNANRMLKELMSSQGGHFSKTNKSNNKINNKTQLENNYQT